MRGDTMQDRIVFAQDHRICVKDAAGTRYWDSDVLTRYRQNLQSIRERREWKQQGSGAAFRGETADAEEISLAQARAAVACVQCFVQEDAILYSFETSDFSGLSIKPVGVPEQSERHILHKPGVQFRAFDYLSSRGQIAVAICSEDTQHIGLVNPQGGSYKVVTDGDCVDDNPCWSRTEPGVLYYNSCGIARAGDGHVLEIGPSALLRLDLNRGDLQEICACAGSDCILPRQDSQGNLYFIQKPYRPIKRSMTLLDVLAVPYKLGRAVFAFLDVFTRSFTGDALNRHSGGPVKTKPQDPKEVLIRGNLIDAEKALKENQGRGEKYPGVAPADWVLMRRSAMGELQTVRKGVLDYDLNAADEIVFSNGKYLIHRDSVGNEEKLDKIDMVMALRAR